MPKAFINESDAKYQKKLNFLDVLSRLVMEKQLLPANLKTNYNGKVPYDVYFPTLQEKVEDRTCRLCGQYFYVKISLAICCQVPPPMQSYRVTQVILNDLSTVHVTPQ